MGLGLIHTCLLYIRKGGGHNTACGGDDNTYPLAGRKGGKGAGRRRLFRYSLRYSQGRGNGPDERA